MKTTKFLILALLTLIINNVHAQTQTQKPKVPYEIKERSKKKFEDIAKVIPPGTWGWYTTNEYLPESSSAINNWPLVSSDHCKPTKALCKDFYRYGEIVCYVWDGFVFKILYVQFTKNPKEVRWNPQYIECNNIPQI